MKKCIIVIISVFYSFLCADMLFAATDTWTQKADFGGTARGAAVGFSIGNKGYLGMGWGNPLKKDFWEYDPAANTWTQKADFGGTGRYAAVGFSIESKGYIGTGDDWSSHTKDFWEYDPAANTWARKADFGGTERFAAIGFSIGSKGYLGTGWGASPYKDFWEYDPAANTWTRKADFGGTARNASVGFSIGSKGYIGTGWGNPLKKDFWEYDPAANTWTQKADFGGTARWLVVGFSIGSKGYIGTGDTSGSFDSLCRDFWEYDPVANTWTRKADFGGTGRYRAIGFSIGSKGYIGTGESGVGLYNKDFWEYEQVAPTCTYSISPTLTSFGTSVARTDTVAVTSSSSICTWTATSNDAWITVTPGSSGSGNGTVSWSIPENSGPARTGTITIAGKTYTIMQGGATYLLTASYTGWGMVASSPAGISCGSDCTQDYTGGTLVTLTANPVSGWTFTGWSGNFCSPLTPTTCQVTMDSSKLVTANFADVTGPTGSASIRDDLRDDTYIYVNLNFDDTAKFMSFKYVYIGEPTNITTMSAGLTKSLSSAAPMSSSCVYNEWSPPETYSSTKALLEPCDVGVTEVWARVTDAPGNETTVLAGIVVNGSVKGYVSPAIASLPFFSTGKPAKPPQVGYIEFSALGEPVLGKILIPSHRPGNWDLIIKDTKDTFGYHEVKILFTIKNDMYDHVADLGYIDLIPYGIPGDLNGDKAVTLADAIMALQATVGMSVTLPTDYKTSGVTVDSSGKVGLQDLLYILQKAADLRQ